MRTPVPALVPLLLVAASTPYDDRVRIDAAVEPGRTAVNVDVRSEWQLDSPQMRWATGNAPRGGWQYASTFDGGGREHARLRWDESVETTDGGRALTGECRFAELRLDRDVHGSFIQPERADRTSPLHARSPYEGLRSVYRWEPEGARYACTLVADTPSDEPAPPRPSPCDELAPGRSVSVGAAWHVDGRVLRVLLEPGASFEFEDEFGGLVRPWSTRADVEAKVSDLRVELREVFETDDGHFAELALRGRVEWERDRSADLADERAAITFYGVRPDVVRETIEIEARDRVTWDLARPAVGARGRVRAPTPAARRRRPAGRDRAGARPRLERDAARHRQLSSGERRRALTARARGARLSRPCSSAC